MSSQGESTTNLSPTAVETWPDIELLKHLLGIRQAQRLYKGQLRPLFFPPAPESVASKCAVARELVLRALREQATALDVLSAPSAVRDYLRLKLCALEHEVFVGLFLDAQNRVLAIEELFRGTLTQTAVYPRELVKAALRINAAAVIFAHNHPSGVAEPSRADEVLTQNLKHTLSLIDVKVLDHFVVGRCAIMSFAERGLI